MKPPPLWKDPFEVAFEQEEEEEEEEEEAEEPPPPPPPPPPPLITKVDDDTADENNNNNNKNKNPITQLSSSSTKTTGKINKVVVAAVEAEEEDLLQEDDDDNIMEVELGKFPSATGIGDQDPDKMAKMQEILSQFTEEQMSRYESFRRSGFQKANMKKLLASITGSPKISIPMTIVVSGIAKMFVGELVETGRIVMTERRETGPIRPCHIREAYRRLKLEGKVPKRSVPRLFR